MKTGEAAKVLGVDRTTIINWIEHRGLDRFFSDSASGRDGGTQRVLTESDLVALNTIRAFRAVNMNWPEIARLLDSGQRETEVPQNAAITDKRTIPVQQAEISARAMATVTERDQALVRVDELSAQVEDLTRKLDLEREQVRALLRELGDLRERLGDRDRLAQDVQASADYQRELLQEVRDLQRQIGKLEGQLEAYRGSSAG